MRQFNDKEVSTHDGFDIVHPDAIRFFPELVAESGVDPEALLRSARIDPLVLSSRGSVLPYSAMVNLLENAAAQLRCPDFGLRLAALQGGTRVMGPIGIAMKNSQTLGQALGYCAKQIQAYSLATRVRFLPDRPHHKLFVRLEVLLDGLANKPQVIEHALALAALNVIDITGGAARVRHVSFRHLPLSSMDLYQDAFGCKVVFGADADGIVFFEQDLLCPVIDPNEQVYEMATSFIANRYPPRTPPLYARVRSLISLYLGDADCSNERVAAELCMHPRTLQRRLKCEGKSFESIKDEVRREVAIRYIKRGEITFAQVAEKLGYAQQSVFSRSCYRWFAASPRELREQSRVGAYLTAAKAGDCG